MSTLPLLSHPAAGVYLSAEEERSLLERFIHHGDRKALDRIIVAHVRMVARIARAYRHFGVPMEDLVQEGCLGLQKAAESFDLTRDFRFATYGTWCARTAIRMHVITNARMVRGGLSAQQKCLFFNYSRMKTAFSAGIDSQSWEVNAKIAVATGTSIADVERISLSEVSLDRNISVAGEDVGPKVDSLADDRPLQDEIVDAQMRQDAARNAIAAAMAMLPARERAIMESRWFSEEPRTLRDLGAELGISGERVRMLEAVALKKIKAELTSRGVTAAHI